MYKLYWMPVAKEAWASAVLRVKEDWGMNPPTIVLALGGALIFWLVRSGNAWIDSVLGLIALIAIATFAALYYFAHALITIPPRRDKLLRDQIAGLSNKLKVEEDAQDKISWEALNSKKFGKLIPIKEAAIEAFSQTQRAVHMETENARLKWSIDQILKDGQKSKLQIFGRILPSTEWSIIDEYQWLTTGNMTSDLKHIGNDPLFAGGDSSIHWADIAIKQCDLKKHIDRQHALAAADEVAPVQNIAIAQGSSI